MKTLSSLSYFPVSPLFQFWNPRVCPFLSRLSSSNLPLPLNLGPGFDPVELGSDPSPPATSLSNPNYGASLSPLALLLSARLAFLVVGCSLLSVARCGVAPLQSLIAVWGWRCFSLDLVSWCPSDAAQIYYLQLQAFVLWLWVEELYSLMPEKYTLTNDIYNLSQFGIVGLFQWSRLLQVPGVVAFLLFSQRFSSMSNDESWVLLDLLKCPLRSLENWLISTAFNRCNSNFTMLPNFTFKLDQYNYNQCQFSEMFSFTELQYHYCNNFYQIYYQIHSIKWNRIISFKHYCFKIDLFLPFDCRLCLIFASTFLDLSIFSLLYCHIVFTLFAILLVLPQALLVSSSFYPFCCLLGLLGLLFLLQVVPVFSSAGWNAWPSSLVVLLLTFCQCLDVGGVFGPSSSGIAFSSMYNFITLWVIENSLDPFVLVTMKTVITNCTTPSHELCETWYDISLMITLCSVNIIHHHLGKSGASCSGFIATLSFLHKLITLWVIENYLGYFVLVTMKTITTNYTTLPLDLCETWYDISRATIVSSMTIMYQLMGNTSTVLWILYLLYPNIWNLINSQSQLITNLKYQFNLQMLHFQLLIIVIVTQYDQFPPFCRLNNTLSSIAYITTHNILASQCQFTTSVSICSFPSIYCRCFYCASQFYYLLKLKLHVLSNLFLPVILSFRPNTLFCAICINCLLCINIAMNIMPRLSYWLYGCGLFVSRLYSSSCTCASKLLYLYPHFSMLVL